MSPTEAIVVPTGRALLIGGVPPITGQPFPPGTLVGATIVAAAGSGDELVRPRVDVGGRAFAGLVRVDPGNPPQISDALEIRVEEAVKPLVNRPWYQVGSYGYHAHHDGGRQRRGPWSLALDATSSLLSQTRRAEVSALLEAVIGIMVTARGTAPARATLCSFPDPVDFTEALDADNVDWNAILDRQPSPWRRLAGGLKRASDAVGADGVVVCVSDGLPADLSELERADAGAQLILVVLGTGPKDYLPSRRPTQAWRNELAPLDAMERRGVIVVSIDDLAGVADNAIALADALVPKQGAPS